MQIRSTNMTSGVVSGITATCRLPVSGLVVDIRHPTGREDMLLLEATCSDARLAFALADSLARATDGKLVEWKTLSVTDLDVFILRLRQQLIGDRVRADVACRAPNCRKRIDVDFSIDAYLDHHLPNGSKLSLRGWSVNPVDDEPRWFCLAPPLSRGRDVPGAGQVRFRLPTVGDLLALGQLPDADEELARLCIRPAELPSRLRRSVEAAMEAMAPSLCGDLNGICPECGAHIPIYFDARQYCLQELRGRSAFVYEDIDILAQRYHWSEGAILAMPHSRRASYAEVARQSRGL
jgi:hypothetical protein